MSAPFVFFLCCLSFLLGSTYACEVMAYRIRRGDFNTTEEVDR